MASEELEAPYAIPTRYPRGKYLLVSTRSTALRTSTSTSSVGSIFSILRAPDAAASTRAPRTSCSPAPSRCAPATRSTARRPCWCSPSAAASHAFHAGPALGEFFLTPPATCGSGDDAANSRSTRPTAASGSRPSSAMSTNASPARPGPRGKDFNMRWVASLVAETHRILMRGGVFLYPRDTKDPSKTGRLRLLYEANPIAFVDRAGRRRAPAPAANGARGRSRRRCTSAFRWSSARARRSSGSSATTRDDAVRDEPTRRCSASAACSARTV